MAAPKREEQLRRLILEYQLMQGTAQLLQQRYELIQSTITELQVAESSLRSLKETQLGANILVPVGGNTFVNAKLGALDKVIVGIGASVSVDMDIDKAIENITERLKEVDKSFQAIQQQLEQITLQMQIHQEGINKLGKELKGEAPSV
ncbi:prefoldin subunit alpha [Candidatus Bathyarchaeota archaeon]|nr:prefoldin subunit alpha [Candidatus Bathyarchaeota archaeon]MBS7630076.1 prefoldin subunit alpha [Candidatus Bathyarchaeota archaeon]